MIGKGLVIDKGKATMGEDMGRYLRVIKNKTEVISIP